MGQTSNSERLIVAIRDATAKAARFRDRKIGEQDTKASLIEPILEALGWDIRDPDEVRREFRPTGKDSPVDYALKLLRKPRLFLEAKGLGEDLGDRKWITQVLSYAVVAGVQWWVLSDGNCYRFYNATAAVDADEKLFCSLRLTESDPVAAARTLALISRRNMEGNLLETLWSAHFIDRRVKAVLQEMFASADPGFVRLVQRKTLKLTPKQIAGSLRRLDVRIEIPAATPPDDREVASSSAGEPSAVPAGRQPKRRVGPKKSRVPKAHIGVPLSEIIQAGLLKPPVALFRRYKGTMLEATLHVDGSVEFQGTRYPSCSTSAEIARGTVTGRRMNTNGWSFWQCRDGNGRAKELTAVRTEYLARRAPPQLTAVARSPIRAGPPTNAGACRVDNGARRTMLCATEPLPRVGRYALSKV